MTRPAAGLTVETLLAAYAGGIFPMAESRTAPEIFWVDPTARGVLPLNGFHLSRSLRRRIRTHPFDIRFDTDFDGVVAACGGRPETWINDEIAALYANLHRAGFAHSIELYDGDTLVGGVYGVTIGAAFFGESMFSRRTDASKIALAHMTKRLCDGGFTLFDTQFLTPHLASLGAVEIPRAEYHRRLARAIGRPARFDPDTPVLSPDELIAWHTADQTTQPSTQTS